MMQFWFLLATLGILIEKVCVCVCNVLHWKKSASKGLTFTWIASFLICKIPC